MFSLCKTYKDEYEHGGTQIKGGYMLRYKRRLFWSSWSEEWVVLYDDSTMAWFKDASGKCMASNKHLVKESAEMLAVSRWTGQIPRRPPLPPGATVTQLVALGPRRGAHSATDVVWMLAKSEKEMLDWMNAISKTLPPPPQIELVMSLPYLRTAFKRPTVRVRQQSSPEVTWRGAAAATAIAAGGAAAGRGLVALLKRQVPLAGQLGHPLEWGQGWGWVTLPNGVWTGRLTWSQEGDDFALHAAPLLHHSNSAQACAGMDGLGGATGYEAYDSYDGYDNGPVLDYEDASTDDLDFNIDCGDFMM